MVSPILPQDAVGPPLPPVAEIKAAYPDFRLDVPLFRGTLDPHQHVAVACAHVARKFLNADKVGLGKQQPVETPTLTPEGWVPLGSVTVGSYVTGSDGQPTKVTGVHPQGVKPTYRVTLSDGSSTEAGPEHLWTVRVRKSAPQVPGRPRGFIWKDMVLTTDQLRLRPVLNGRDMSKEVFYIPMLGGPATFLPATNPLPIPPYALGQLLANGSLAHGTPDLVVNTLDAAEILGWLGVATGAKRTVGGSTHILVTNKMVHIVRALRLDVLSAEKFIPRLYFTACPDDRVSLLQGLMDGDGTVSATGNKLCYCTTSLRLAADVQELVEGLGGIASQRWYDRSAEGKPAECQVRIRLPAWVPPFRVTRKASRYAPGGKWSKTLPCRTVTSVEYVRDAESVCITVEAQDQLYVTEHCILTHNSVETLGVVAYQAGHGQAPRWVIVAETAQLYQWADAVRGFLGIEPVVLRGGKAGRLATYMTAQDPAASFIWIMTYGLIRADGDDLALIPGLNFAFDEAVILANKNATSEKAAVLCSRARHVILMTAEPITRGDPTQVGRLFRVMGIPLGGMSEEEFDARFCVRKTTNTWVRGRWGKAYQKPISTVVGVRDPEVLRALMLPNSIRRGDSVLPDGAFTVNRQIRTCAMTKVQAAAYRDLKEGTLAKLRGGKMKPADKLQAADALMQVLVSPWVWDATLDWRSPKAELVLKILGEEVPDEQAVLFCRHKRSVSLISRYLEAAGVGHATYTGADDAEARHAKVAAFGRGEHRVLLTSYAGHRGVDGLQCCRNLVLVDVLHQPSTVIQMIGRLARRGQKSRVVNVFFPLIEGTVEAPVLAKLRSRQRVTDRIFSEDRSDIFDPSVADLVMEFL